MNPTDIITGILDTKPSLSDVFFVACGGSLVDFYPAHYLISSQGVRLHSGYYPSAEFLDNPPRRLSDDSLTIVCSHNGSTAEFAGGGSPGQGPRLDAGQPDLQARLAHRG